jgi:predicted nicotinamide N-methyase
MREIALPSTPRDWPPRRKFELPGDQRTIGLRETSFGEGKLGYQLWTAGIALATWLSAYDSLIRDKDVLELGSGIGLPGFACAGVARRVTLSDMDRVREDDWDSPTELLQSLREGVAENSFSDAQVRVIRVDWKDYLPPKAAEPLADSDKYQVVIASDCIYYVQLLPPFAAALRHFLRRDGVAYVMSTDRGWDDDMHATPEMLAAELEAAGWCEITEKRFTCVTPYSEEKQVLQEIRWRTDALEAGDEASAAA